MSFKITPLCSLVIALIARVPNTLMLCTMMLKHTFSCSKNFTTVGTRSFFSSFLVSNSSSSSSSSFSQ